MTPDELAAHLGALPRRVKDDVRAIGCYCKFGRKIIMREHHVETYMKAMECHLGSPSAAKSGTTAGQLPVGDYEALRDQRTRKSQLGLRRKSKQKHGEVILMDWGQH
jgi:erythromycin esterase-like protein